jgi:hypothetical protein
MKKPETQLCIMRKRKTLRSEDRISYGDLNDADGKLSEANSDGNNFVSVNFTPSINFR